MKKSLLLGAAMMMAGGAMAQIAPGEYYIKNVETGMFLNEGFSWGTLAVTKAYPCAFQVTTPVPDTKNWVLLGNEDNTTPFFSARSEAINLKGDGTVDYQFYNFHKEEAANWDNWLLVVTNGIPFGEEGYVEYLVLRADRYGWGTLYDDGKTLDSDFDWDTFVAEMQGALVDITITRDGSDANIYAKVTAENGIERFESIKLSGIETEEIGTFLTCENSHLLINPNPLNEDGYIFKSAYGYFKPDNGEYYMDGGNQTVTYLEKSGDYYNLKVGGNYLTINEEQDYLNNEWLMSLNMCETLLYTVKQSAELDGDKSLWEIISRDEMVAALADATEENPVEASFFLNAGQIEVNADNNISSWPYVKNNEPSEIVLPDGGWFGHDQWFNKTTYAWCINDEPTADCIDVVSQEVEGMPAGMYTVNYRAVNQGNEGETPLVIKFNDTEAAATNWEGTDLWYASAQDVMAHNVETASFEVKEDGKLTIKMEKTSKVGLQNRFAFKSFALSYLGAKEVSGVAGVEVDENAPVEYFNMQGLRVANPSNGIYIKRQGKNVSKVVVK